MGGFEFNKVFILESLDFDELTGTELYNDILRRKEYKINNFKSDLIQIENVQDFIKKLNFIKSECRYNKIFPILHFEIHGNQLGLVLKSGELFKWIELYEHLIQINSIVGNNLFMTMAVCNGAYIMELIKPFKPSPFWGFIGSFEIIENYDLLIRYNEFYDVFLDSFDLNKAIERLHKSNPDIPSSYHFINSEAAFIKIYSDYFKNNFSESELKRRFKCALRQDNIIINDRKAFHNFNFKFQFYLLNTKKEIFEKDKKIFFMLDNFPFNEKKFPITFEELNNGE